MCLSIFPGFLDRGSLAEAMPQGVWLLPHTENTEAIKRIFIKVALKKSTMKVHTFLPNNLLWETYKCSNIVTYKQGGLL